MVKVKNKALVEQIVTDEYVLIDGAVLRSWGLADRVVRTKIPSIRYRDLQVLIKSAVHGITDDAKKADTALQVINKAVYELMDYQAGEINGKI